MVKTCHVVMMCCVFISLPALCKPLNPVELNECIYSYWGQRVKGGLIDAQAATDTAKANLYPSVTGSVITQNDYLSVPTTGYYTGTYASLNQQLINIAQWTNIHAKKVSEKAAELDFEDQLLTLMKSATKSYFDYVVSEDKLKLLQKRISRIDKAVALTKEISRLHLADPSSVYLAQADKAQLDISIANTQVQSKATLNLLQASIGLGNGSLELEDSHDPKVSGDLSYWSKKVDELPGIEMLKTKAEASDAAAISARDQRIPSLALGAYYGQVPSGLGANPSGESALVMFTLSIPIFDQGLTSVQTQQAESQKSVNEALVFSKREQLLAEIKNLLNDWHSDEKILTSAKDQLDNAQQGYQALITLFSFGKAAFISLKNSEASLIDAETQVDSIQRKIAQEKTTLELLDGYSAGRHRPSPSKAICPIRN